MIPLAKPSITKLEKKYLNQAIDEGYISGSGYFIDNFENKWASYNGYKYGVSCNSGTTAMYLALLALGIKKGDEVIVPEFTMIATAWAVTYTGAKPIFVDCDDRLNMDMNKVEEKITPNTKVIMPVHIYGRACNMKEIKRIAKKYNLYIVEDMAEAHGIIPHSDIACFSFQGNKIITTGEGGMCLTDDKKLAEEIRKFSSLYFDKDRTLIHEKIGHNFRMTNIQASIGLAQIERIDNVLERRRDIEQMYNDYLPHEYLMPKRDVLWMYDINCGDKRDIIKARLKDRGVDSRYFFKPMSTQPMYKETIGDDSRLYKLNAYKWSLRGLYLPVYDSLTKDNIRYICQSIY
jgi:dTDP-4-amino-4,6-dideoxygalactose transaminase